MPHELLVRIGVTPAKQLFDALDNGTSFFAGRGVGQLSGVASLKREQQEAELIV